MTDAHATLLRLATEGSTTGDVEDHDYGSMCAHASRVHQVDHDGLVDTFETGPGKDLAVVRSRREGRPGPR